MYNYTEYYFIFDDDLPEEFKKIKEGMEPDEVIDLFGLDMESSGWWIDYVDIQSYCEIMIRVYNKKIPVTDVWKAVEEKYQPSSVTCHLYCETIDDLDDLFHRW